MLFNWLFSWAFEMTKKVIDLLAPYVKEIPGFEFINILPVILMVLALVLLLVNFASMYKVTSILKQNHEQLWKELGEPGVFQDLQTIKKWRRFARERGYLETNDEELIRHCNRGRLLERLYWTVFGTLIVVAVMRGALISFPSTP